MVGSRIFNARQSVEQAWSDNCNQSRHIWKARIWIKNDNLSFSTKLSAGAKTQRESQKLTATLSPKNIGQLRACKATLERYTSCRAPISRNFFMT